MNIKFSGQATLTAFSLAAMLGLTSGCATDDPEPHGGRRPGSRPVHHARADDNVDHSARNAGIGVGLGVFALNIMGGNSLQGAALNGLYAGGSTYAVIKSYEASVSQRQVAYSRGEYAVRRTVVRRKVETSGSRVVAVRVPKQPGTAAGGGTVMLVSAESGKPVGDKAYVLKSQPRDGGEVEIGGQRAIYSGDSPL